MWGFLQEFATQIFLQEKTKREEEEEKEEEKRKKKREKKKREKHFFARPPLSDGASETTREREREREKMVVAGRGAGCVGRRATRSAVNVKARTTPRTTAALSKPKVVARGARRGSKVTTARSAVSKVEGPRPRALVCRATEKGDGNLEDQKLVGVDVGGTFTDVVYTDTKTGITLTHKVPTTPENPSKGVLNGIVELCDRYGIERSEITRVLHGTTTATNGKFQGFQE